jgi:Gpi18-like mannosyltransferase
MQIFFNQSIRCRRFALSCLIALVCFSTLHFPKVIAVETKLLSTQQLANPAIPAQDINSHINRVETQTITTRRELAKFQSTPILIQLSTQPSQRTGKWLSFLILILGIGLTFVVALMPRQLISTIIAKIPIKANILKIISFAVLTRLIILLIGYLSYAVLAKTNPTNIIYFKINYFDSVLQAFNEGDVRWYLQIAQFGYENRPFSLDRQANWAFYPLWPVLIKLGSCLVNHPLIVGLILSNLFFLIGLIYLYQLILIDFDEDIAYSTTLLAIIFPSSYFCSRPGPEALFFLLVVVSLFYAKKQQWILAGVFSSLGVLTRFQGILLIFPLLWLYYQQYKKSQIHNFKAFSLLLMPLSIGIFMLYLYFLTGNFFANFSIQKAWDSSASYPFLTIINYLFNPVVVSYYGWDLSILSFAFILLLISLIIIMLRYRKIPLEYVIYTMISTYIIISRNNIQGSLRFMIPIFPLYLVLALLINHKKMGRDLLFFVFISLQTFYFLAFLHHQNWAAT